MTLRAARKLGWSRGRIRHSNASAGRHSARTADPEAAQIVIAWAAVGITLVRTVGNRTPRVGCRPRKSGKGINLAQVATGIEGETGRIVQAIRATSSPGGIDGRGAGASGTASGRTASLGGDTTASSLKEVHCREGTGGGAANKTTRGRGQRNSAGRGTALLVGSSAGQHVGEIGGGPNICSRTADVRTTGCAHGNGASRAAEGQRWWLEA